jgi:glucosamine-6-phosphate deaminase
LELHVFDTIQEASQLAKDVFVKAINENPGCLLGLATGSTPEVLYGLLIEAYKNGEVSFKDVRTVNLDEYVGLGPEHNQSYRYFMNSNLFDHIDIDKNNTNVPDGIGGPEQNAKKYDALLESLGQPDIQLLGIGGNGHIAFNEPGSSFDSTTSIIDLTEETIKANSRFFENIDDVPKKAVSMGIKSILKAKKILLLAFGESKAQAVKDMFELPVTENMPATALKNHPDVMVIVDKAAASLL